MVITGQRLVNVNEVIAMPTQICQGIFG